MIIGIIFGVTYVMMNMSSLKGICIPQVKPMIHVDIVGKLERQKDFIFGVTYVMMNMSSLKGICIPQVKPMIHVDIVGKLERQKILL